MKIWLVKANLFIKNCAISFFRHIFFNCSKSKSPDSVCIVKAGNIGDLICSIPSFNLIRKRYPSSRIVLCSNGGNSLDARYILKGNTIFDDIFVYERNDKKSSSGRNKIAFGLKKYCFDQIIYFSDERATFKSVLLDFWVYKRLGRINFIGGIVTTTRLFPKSQNERLKFDKEAIRLLKQLPFYNGEMPDWSFAISEEDKEYVDSFIRSHNLVEGKILALSIKGKAPVNDWDYKRFVTISRRWQSIGKNYIVSSFGGRDQCNILVRDVGGNQFVEAAGLFNIQQSIYFLQKVSLLISVDTGTAHMSSIAKNKCIVISSSYYFKDKWMPYGDNVFVFRNDDRCNLCLKHTCINQNRNLCINSITADEVWKKICEIMEIE